MHTAVGVIGLLQILCSDRNSAEKIEKNPPSTARFTICFGLRLVVHVHVFVLLCLCLLSLTERIGGTRDTGEDMHTCFELLSRTEGIGGTGEERKGYIVRGGVGLVVAEAI